MEKVFSISSGLSYTIPTASINQLVEFTVATECGKKSIIKNQKHPSAFRVACYRSARAAITRFAMNEFDYHQLFGAIQKLQGKQPSSDWSRRDTQDSIVALRKFIDMNFPQQIGKVHCSFSKATIKECMFTGMRIIVAPDLILRWEENGKHYVGAVKFKIGKKKWKPAAAYRAASFIAYFLSKHVANEDEIVDHSRCFLVDVMEQNTIPAPSNYDKVISDMKNSCVEYVQLWDKVA